MVRLLWKNWRKTQVVMRMEVLWEGGDSLEKKRPRVNWMRTMSSRVILMQRNRI